jgi:nitrite reductase (NADH) small subunit
MTDARWIRVTDRRNIPLREGRSAIVGDREIAIFNLGERFFAVDNRCPHKGGPLCDGIVSGGTVVCPLHAWKIDLETGRVERPVAPQSCVQSYPVRLEGDTLLVQLPLNAKDAKDYAA